jgi:hypothetical protein
VCARDTHLRSKKCATLTRALETGSFAYEVFADRVEQWRGHEVGCLGAQGKTQRWQSEQVAETR